MRSFARLIGILPFSLASVILISFVTLTIAFSLTVTVEVAENSLFSAVIVAFTSISADVSFSATVRQPSSEIVVPSDIPSVTMLHTTSYSSGVTVAAS